MSAGAATSKRTNDYYAVTLTHFFVDVLNSSRNLLVAVLAASIGLSNTQIGLALLLYNVGNALTQPLFGRLADRVGPRWPVVGGVAWMISFFALAAVAGDWLALVAVTVAGLGSGSFHPSGTMVASLTSQHNQNRVTAFFFMSGQSGLFIGPVITGYLLQELGRPGYIVLPLMAVTALLASWRWLSNEGYRTEPAERQSADLRAATQAPGFARHASVLAFVIFTAGTVGIAAATYAPVLFTDLNYSPSYVGWLGGLFMLGSAIGGVVGGTLADRIGGRRAIRIGLFGSVIPLFLYIPAPDTARMALLCLGGFFAGMPHTILVLQVQNLFPTLRATASGLALGFMFFSGSVGGLLVGIAADQIGLAVALRATAFLPLIAGIAAGFLPRRRPIETAAQKTTP